MKNWISAVLIIFLGAGLAGCSTTSSPNPGQAKEQLSSKVTTAQKAVVGKTLAAGKKAPVVLKTAGDKKQTAAKDANVNDKILSLWRHLPSPQWFINDVKQEDVG